MGNEVPIIMGQSPNGENYTDNPNDHILVQGNADMKNGRVTPRVWTTQITKTVEPDDIILSVRAPVGDVGKTDHAVVLGRGVAGIKGSEFIFQTLLRMKETGYWTRYSTGSTFESINSADLKEAVIQIPNLEEQSKIGVFFTNLDKTITLHQRKLDQLKSLKQAYLQQIFPSNGENLPKLRFANFTDSWEQRKFSESVSINSGRDYKHLVTGDIPVYGTGGYMLSVNEKLSEVDSIGLGRKGTIDNPQLLKAPFWTVDTLFFMTPFPEVDLMFLFSIIQRINWKKLDESTGVPSLSKSVISNVNHFIPCYEEQIQIGNLFNKLNDTITLQQQKLKLTQNLKQAYLQKMFV